MTQSPNTVLVDLLARFAATDGQLHIGFDEVKQWPAELLTLLTKAGLLAKGVQASSLICNGCEHNCFEPVAFTPNAQRAFITCGHPDQQEYIGRIAIEPHRLKQWSLEAAYVAGVTATLLGFTDKPTYNSERDNYTLGMLKSPNGRRAVSLEISPLVLTVNQHPLALEELLYIEDKALHIDSEAITYALSTKPPSTNDQYTPNSNKRQASKLATQAIYADWQNEFLRLKQANLGKSDVWIAAKIARSPFGQGKSSETIRKNMKR